MTGCLATAMAQVMYFHQSPSQTINVIPGYTTTSRKTDVNAIPAGTSIDWAYILPTYKTSTGSETEAQRYAVAKLMLLCGTSVKMDYTAAASAAATTEASAALKSVFNYDATTRRVVRLDYKQEEWNQMIYDELAQRRPVLYNGTTATGAGHAFVIDGYDKNDYFHVNWGWSGDCNGFFRLSMLSPTDPGQSEFTNVGFNLSQDAIIGIQKNTYNPITLKLTAAGADIYSDLSRMTRSSSGEDFELYHYFTYYFDNDVSQATFECAVGIYNTVGSLLSVVTNIETGDFASLDKKSFSRAANFGANLSNGTYTLKPIYRKKGELA
jgi:hypothetical protein